MNEVPPNPEERTIAMEALDWPVVEAPDDFADRIAWAHQSGEHAAGSEQPRTPGGSANGPHRWRVIPWRAFAALAALCLLAVLWSNWQGRGAPMRSLLGPQASVIEFDGRGRAVLFEGAQLGWRSTVPAGILVNQGSGRVFYRVDKGNDFVVDTPVGRVEVRGTCFEVEIEAMKTAHLKSGSLGAAVAAALVVSVYEGSVVVDAAGRRHELGPGEHLRALPGEEAQHSRRRHDAGGLRGSESNNAQGAQGTQAQAREAELARTRLRLENERQRRLIARLREDLDRRDAVSEPNKDSSSTPSAYECALADRDEGLDCDMLDPSDETLREMARCGVVKVDFPGFFDDREVPDADGLIEALGVSDPREIEVVMGVAQERYDAYVSALRGFHAELGGDPKLAESMSPSTLRDFVFDQLEGTGIWSTSRAIAEERAALRQPPSDLTKLSLEARAVRMLAGLGDGFEAGLAAELGPERARELRKKHNGWPGHFMSSSGPCPPPGEEAE